jgi:tetratricopeptide (TPR) repeat protein
VKVCNIRNVVLGARGLYEQALDIDREIGNDGTAMWERNGLATVFWQLTRFQAMGDKAGTGSVWNNLGQTLYFAGDLPAAADTLAKALAADRETGYQQDTADVLAWMGRIRLAQGNWDDARRQFAESVRIAGETGNQVFAAQCRVAMTGLSLANGRPAEAESSVRDSLALFERQNRRQSLEARTLLAEALLKQGKIADARQEVDRAAAQPKSSQQLAARLGFAIVAARVEAAEGKALSVNNALRDLRETIATATQHGILSGARLALGEIEAKRGGRGAARALEQLERDARARGFAALASRAAAAHTSAHDAG